MLPCCGFTVTGFAVLHAPSPDIIPANRSRSCFWQPLLPPAARSSSIRTGLSSTTKRRSSTNGPLSGCPLHTLQQSLEKLASSRRHHGMKKAGDFHFRLTPFFTINPNWCANISTFILVILLIFLKKMSVILVH